MISQKVIATAQENGYKFFVNGFGHRKLAEITDLNGKHISWTSNTSKAALQAINTLIAQRKLDAKSNEAIATESEQAAVDLLPIDPWEQRRQERIAAQGNLTSDDFRSTYSPRDTFGDNDFALSGRYGYGALI